MYKSDEPFNEARHQVQVGRPVEITHSERLSLENYAHNMRAAAKSGRRGWFLEYLTAHKASMAMLQTIMRRSHAN